jgi:hypothetical protein
LSFAWQGRNYLSFRAIGSYICLAQSDGLGDEFNYISGRRNRFRSVEIITGLNRGAMGQSKAEHLQKLLDHS